MLAVFFEPMQMAIGPAYDGLEGLMEATQTEGIWYLDQPPDRRTNLLESDPQFVNAKLGFRFAVFVSAVISIAVISIIAGRCGRRKPVYRDGPDRAKAMVAERESGSWRP